MTHRFFARAVFLGVIFGAVAGMVVACGSSDESSGTAATAVHAAPVPFDRLLPGFIDALCGPIEACCNDQGYGYKPGACAATFAVATPGTVGVNVALAVPADAGVTYDPQAGGDCLAALRSYQSTCATPVASATAFLAVLALSNLDSTAVGASYVACEKLFTGGRTPAGAPCTQSYECKGSVPGSTPGCSFETPKDGGAPTGRCIEILPTAADGAHCTGSIDHAFDGTSSQFTPCAGNGRFDAKSGSIAGLGVCDDATKTCKSYAVASDGQHCDDILTACGPSSFCNKSFVCQAAGQAGASCDGGGVRCASTTNCNATTRLCTPLAPLGAACTEGYDCASGNCNEKRVCSSAVPGIANARLCGG